MQPFHSMRQVPQMLSPYKYLICGGTRARRSLAGATSRGAAGGRGDRERGGGEGVAQQLSISATTNARKFDDSNKNPSARIPSDSYTVLLLVRPGVTLCTIDIIPSGLPVSEGHPAPASSWLFLARNPLRVPAAAAREQPRAATATIILRAKRLVFALHGASCKEPNYERMSGSCLHLAKNRNPF